MSVESAVAATPDEIGRIVGKYGRQLVPGPAEAVSRIGYIAALHVLDLGEGPIEHPQPDRAEIIEALRLVEAARREVDSAEWRLFTAARVAGVTLEAIGVALGFPPETARQRAWHRAKALGVSTSEEP